MGVPSGARVDLPVERDGLVDHRADAIADVAAQAEEIEAGLLVDEHRQTHFRLVDVLQGMIQGAGRTGLDAGDVLAHLAGQLARDEVGRAGGHRLFGLGQVQDVEGAIAHAQAATDAGGGEFGFRQCTGRPYRSRRQGLGMPRVESDAQPQQPTPQAMRAVSARNCRRAAALGLFSLSMIPGRGAHFPHDSPCPPLRRVRP
jgi:hypothetical protein